MTTSAEYLTTFFEEKQLPTVRWELTDKTGMSHSISNEVVIEHIMATGDAEQTQIAGIIRKIDFKNGDVNHLLEHLAGAIINQ